MSLPAANLPAATRSDWRRCPRCRLGLKGCLCAGLPAIASSLKVVLLQHPREAKNPNGTARLAHLSLRGSELLIGLDFETDPRLRALLEAAGPNVGLLFPGPNARPASELALLPRPATLLAIDGTWSQAQKLYRLNPMLHRLPCYRLDPERPSEYLIRGEPAPHCVSTIEALGLALDAAEGTPGHHEALLAPLRALVTRQLGYAQGPERSPRRFRRTPQPKRLPPPPAPLVGAMERALLVYGEGNGLSTDGDFEDAGPELVQWVALRPATGERFEAILRPARLVDAAERFLGFDLPRWPTLETPEAFRARWSRFVREDDLWCSWGHFPMRLFGGVSGAPPFIDLRPWVHARLEARTGIPETAFERLALPMPEIWAAGRAGQRIAQLQAIVETLSKGESSALSEELSEESRLLEG